MHKDAMPICNQRLSNVSQQFHRRPWQNEEGKQDEEHLQDEIHRGECGLQN